LESGWSLEYNIINKVQKRKERLRESCSESVAPTGEKRKVVGKEWEPNSFSSRYFLSLKIYAGLNLIEFINDFIL